MRLVLINLFFNLAFSAFQFFFYGAKPLQAATPLEHFHKTKFLFENAQTNHIRLENNGNDNVEIYLYFQYLYVLDPNTSLKLQLTDPDMYFVWDQDNDCEMSCKTLFINNAKHSVDYTPISVKKKVRLQRKDGVDINCEDDKLAPSPFDQDSDQNFIRIFGYISGFLEKKENQIHQYSTFFHQATIQLVFDDKSQEYFKWDQLLISKMNDFQQQEKYYQDYFDERLAGVQLWRKILSNESGVIEKQDDLPETIGSFTTYPDRAATAWLVVESWFRQKNAKFNRVVLNLFIGDFKGQQIPFLLKKQTERGLEINWCSEDLKMYLKVIPTLQKYPTAEIVYFDDDIIYASHLLADFKKASKDQPGKALCVAARIIQTKNIETNEGFQDYILPASAWIYSNWKIDFALNTPNKKTIPLGVFSVYLPPNSFQNILHHLSDREKFFTLCKTDDDLWIYLNMLLAELDLLVLGVKEPLKYIGHTQAMPTALWKRNDKNRYELLTTYFINIYNENDYKIVRNIFNNSKILRHVEEIKRKNLQKLKWNQWFDFQEMDSNFECPIDLFTFGPTGPDGVYPIEATNVLRLYFPFYHAQYELRMKVSGISDIMQLEIKENNENIVFEHIYKNDYISFIVEKKENISEIDVQIFLSNCLLSNRVVFQKAGVFEILSSD